MCNLLARTAATKCAEFKQLVVDAPFVFGRSLHLVMPTYVPLSQYRIHMAESYLT